MALGAGIEFENALFKPIIDPVFGQSQNNSFLNYFGFLRMDNLDDAFYPTRGIRYDSELKLITSGNYHPMVFAANQLNFAAPLSSRFSLIGHISAGLTFGDSIHTQYMFYTGGSTRNIRSGIMPFTGLEFMEVKAKNVLIAGLDLQMRALDKVYFILKTNLGNMEDNLSNLFDPTRIIKGYGITAGYNSFIGPIDFTLSGSDYNHTLIGYARIGFYF
jgi:NTE family protein